MKKAFAASLCRNGILGGGLFMRGEVLVYKTGKVTVEPRFRNLEMPLCDIISVENGRLLLLPTVELEMKNGEKFRFVVFARKAFLTALAELGVNLVPGKERSL